MDCFGEWDDIFSKNESISRRNTLVAADLMAVMAADDRSSATVPVAYLPTEQAYISTEQVDTPRHQPYSKQAQHPIANMNDHPIEQLHQRCNS